MCLFERTRTALKACMFNTSSWGYCRLQPCMLLYDEVGELNLATPYSRAEVRPSFSF
jgi:hypothetical protein